MTTGDTASFTCVADGVPLPNILWLHNERLIVPAFNHRITIMPEIINSTFRPSILTAHNSTLIIDDLLFRDAGDYTCIAELNSVMSDTKARRVVSQPFTLQINESKISIM